MLTNKITGFSADLLNTVRGILGEAKKCGDCGCGQCECEKEEAKEGYVPTADEPTDANKKTAQKIRDMMAKEKKPVKEESDLEEKRGLWDNIHAKRKRIKGGSGEKMRKPGSEGAPTAADFKASANEEVERVDEVSKATLGRYINKAKNSVDLTAWRQGYKEAGAGNPSKQLEKKLSKRHKGIETAVKKLTKEESEQIDELSKGTMGRYINKAATKMGSQGVTAGLKIAADEKSSKNFKDMGKREKGIKLAVSKLTKEESNYLEKDLKKRKVNNDKAIKDMKKMGSPMRNPHFGEDVELDEGSYKDNPRHMGTIGPITTDAERRERAKKYREKLTKEEQDFVDSLNADTLDEARGRPKKAGAKDFTIHPKTKEKLMHNNPEHMAKIERLQKNKIIDKPKVEASQHIMNQLSKAKTSMQGGSTIHFTHGDSKHVSGTHAAKLISKYQAMKPSEKEDFQKKIGHSHEQLMKHV